MAIIIFMFIYFSHSYHRKIFIFYLMDACVTFKYVCKILRVRFSLKKWLSPRTKFSLILTRCQKGMSKTKNLSSWLAIKFIQLTKHHLQDFLLLERSRPASADIKKGKGNFVHLMRLCLKRQVGMFFCRSRTRGKSPHIQI